MGSKLTSFELPNKTMHVKICHPDASIVWWQIITVCRHCMIDVLIWLRRLARLSKKVSQEGVLKRAEWGPDPSLP